MLIEIFLRNALSSSTPLLIFCISVANIGIVAREFLVEDF